MGSNKLDADWVEIGPMPTDPALERKLDRVKYENNHTQADEQEWIKRGEANAKAYALTEEQFFSELDKQIDSD